MVKKFDFKALINLEFVQHSYLMWPRSYNLNNTQTALDKSISARAVLLNEKRHSRLARSERRFFNSIPRPSNEQVLRRFVFYNEECRAFRINTKCDTCIILSYLIYNLHKAMVLIKFQINDWDRKQTKYVTSRPTSESSSKEPDLDKTWTWPVPI